jgi:hypothetical protein
MGQVGGLSDTRISDYHSNYDYLSGGIDMIQRNIELGYGIVTKDAMQDRNLTIEAKAIYSYLCSFAGGKDEAWPSIDKMCYDFQIEKRRLRKHIKVLVDNEYIEIEKYRYTKTSQFANNHYIILK